MQANENTIKKTKNIDLIDEVFMEGKNVKILIIDDIQDNLTVLQALIQDAFPESIVFQALNGLQGLEIAKQEDPDVIFLDVVMPGMDGFEVCHKIKENRKLRDIPIVFITALKGDKESRIRALECGAEAFIAKPIDIYELTAQIQSMVKIRKANQQKRNESLRLAELVRKKTRELLEAQKLAHIGSFVLDMVNMKLKCTDEALDLCGIKRADFSGAPETIIQQIHPEDRAYAIQQHTKAISEKCVVEYECRLVKPDGEERIVSVHTSPTFDKNGVHTQTLGTILDITDSERAKLALARSEEKFQLLFNKAPLGYQSLDGDGCFIDVNQQWLDTLGYTREEVIGAWFGDFLCPEYRELFRQRFPMFKAQGQIHSEFEMLNKDGRRQFIAFEGKIGYNVDGTFKQTHCILQDITERKHYEEQRDQVMMDLVESQRIAHIGTWRLNLETNQVKWSEELYKMYGFDPSIPPPPFTEHMKLFTPESWERLSTALEATRTSGIPYEMELQTIRQDGTNGWMWVRGEANKNTNGNIISLWGAAQDISERKHYEENIKKQNEIMMSLLKVLPVGVFMVDASDGRPLLANDMAKNLLGRGILPDANQINLAEVYKAHKRGSTDPYPIEERPIVKGMKGQNSHTDDMVIEHPDGSEVLLEIFGTPIKDEAGKPWASLVTFADITERTRVFQELEETLKFNQDIINSSSNGIVVYDTDLRYKIWNPYMEKLTGIAASEVIGHKPEEVFPWHIQNDLINTMQEAVKGKKLPEKDFSINVPKTQKSGWIRDSSGPLYNQNDEIIGGLSIIQDITERKLAEDLLKQSEEKFRLLYTSMDQGLALHEIITDADGKPIDYVFLDINESYTHLLGVTREMCIGKRITEVMPKVEQYWIDIFGQVALTGEPSYYENYLETTGSYYSTYSYSPKHRQFAVLVTDITEKKKNEEKLIYMSYHDNLTGLYNRRFFEEELRRLDTKRNLPLSVIMGDINGLKIINDSFGHAVGDDYLKKAAQIINKACRADDIVARLGGDEFAVILPNADASITAKIIDRIKEMMSEVDVAMIGLSISFGYALKEREDQSILETIIEAENHMYAHKIYERSSMRSKTIDIIMNTLFEKSNRESLHSNRVSAICEAIAKNMKFSEDDINRIRTAGLVHDIGKIGIREEILNKADRLDRDEWKEITRHPEAGWRILNTVAEFAEISGFVLRHHEKWDGSGYPNGIRGEEIPIEARIIAVADAYDAMTSERSYRKPVSIETAAAEIIKYAGKQFDPQIVDVFLKDVLPSL